VTIPGHNEAQPDDAMVDRLIATAIERGERARLRRIGVYGAATFAVAMLAVGLAWQDGRRDPTRIVDANPGEMKVIRLAYESSVDRPDTTVVVSLSDRLDLVGYADTRDLEWKTALKKGVNVLELPVVLNSADDAQLTVAFSSGDDSKRVRVVIRAADRPPLNEVRLAPVDRRAWS
jgi:hypothetical protein